MKERMQRFMAGRYGNDQLNQFIFIVAIISMVLEIITRQSLFYTLTLVLLILAYVRVFSRNINKRYEENMKFLQKKDAILNKFRKQKYYAAQRRNFHIYTCPQCKQKIRIPKGKGRSVLHVRSAEPLLLRKADFCKLLLYFFQKTRCFWA